MADEFTLARRKKVIDAFKRATRDLVELDGGPFAEFRTDIIANGEPVTVVLKVERP